MFRKVTRRFCTQKDLQNILKKIKENPMMTRLNSTLKKDIPEVQIKREDVEQPYLRSLFYQRRSPEDTDYSDIIERNFLDFVGEVHKEHLLLKNMSTEEINRIHVLIDIRMQEIENSGLSRSQLAGMHGKWPLYVFIYLSVC